MNDKKMKRVTKTTPCPVCGKPDWCLVADDGSAAICARIEEGSVKKAGDAGWLHRITGPTSTPNTVRSRPPKQVLTQTYDYTDANGTPLYQVCRYHPKGFRQRRPNGQKNWIWNLEGVPRMLYRLPELLQADPEHWVFVTEGEKDTDRLAGLGLLTTTNAGGAGKWNTLGDVSALHDRKVAILPDQDNAGLKHAEQVAQSLYGKAAEIKIVNLPNLPEKGDVSDWLDMGHDQDELLRLVEQAPTYAPCTASETKQRVPAYQTFPVEVLPQPVRRFVTVTAKAIGCDPAYVALPVMTALAAAIGNTRRIKLKQGWTEPAVIWTGIVGESGTMKSPAVEIAIKSMMRKQAEAIRQHQEDMNQYLAEEEHHKVALANWRKNGHKKCDPCPEPPRRPVCQRLVCSDVTVEALADRLQDAPRGLLVVRDELAGWVQSFNQYKGGKGSDSAHWLSMHRAQELLVDRKTGDKATIYVPRAAVSITGGVQPDILRRVLGQEYFDNGMAARLLLAMPPRRIKIWNDRGIPESLEAELAEILDRLLALEPNVPDDGAPYPVDVPLSAEALKLFVKFHNEHNAELIELHGEEAAAWCKLEGYAARLALVVHCVRAAAGDASLSTLGAVDEDSVAAGVTLARWFGYETRRIYAVLRESEQDRELRRLSEVIERTGGQVSVREWQRIRHHKTAEAAKAELNALVEAGWGRWQSSSSSPQGGRPTEILVLCDSVTGDKTSAGAA